MSSLFRYYLNQIKICGGSFFLLRYYWRWKKSLEKDASSVKDEQPWITFKTIDFLNTYLHSKAKVFEYGGGGSSLFFLKRVNQLVTVEHNKEWFGILTDMVAKKKYSNWVGNYIEVEEGDYVSNPDISNPEHYASDDIPSKNKHYRKYASAIEHFENNYFDVILVDGRSRPSCMKHAIPKLKKGGLLVLDNSDRKYYLPFFEAQLKTEFTCMVDAIGPSPYAQEFTKTSIWKKK